jgi:hypothetical protein
MKPDQRQLKVLADYLHKTLSYRETYEEIYDHILTALEHQPDGVRFEDAVNNIICNDFGSPGNLLKIEKANKDALVKESTKKYMNFFTSYFKLPLSLYTLPLILLLYYFLSQMKFNLILTGGALIVGAIFPGFIMLLRLYNTGYLLDTTKRSARDRLFETLAGIPGRGLMVLTLLAYSSVYNVWKSTEYYGITALLTLIVIYNLSLYKLYKDEFKTALAK